MKRFIIAVLGTVSVVSACSEAVEEVTTVSSVELSAESVSAGPDGGTYEITVTSSENWRVTGTPVDWVTLSSDSGTSGETLTLTVDRNESDVAKETSFKIFAGSAVRTLSVLSSPEYYLELLSDTENSLTSDGGTLKIQTRTNIPDLEVSFVGNDSSWIRYEGQEEAFGSTILTFNVNASEIYLPRTVQVTVKGVQGNDRTVSFNVNQAQLDAVLCDETYIETDLDASELTIVTRSNVETVPSFPSWIELVGDPVVGTASDDGLTERTYRFNTQQSQGTRQGEITFRHESVSLLSVTVRQQNPSPIYADIADEELCKYLSDFGWILADEQGRYEVVYEGMTGTTLPVTNLRMEEISGLGAFPALTTLTITNNYISVIDLSDCKGITSLSLNSTYQLSRVDMGSDNPLDRFILLSNPSTYFSYLTSESLTIAGDNLVYVDVQASGNGMSYYESCTSLDVTGCPSLATLYATREFGYGNPRQCRLETIYMTSSQISSVYVEKSDMTQIVTAN